MKNVPTLLRRELGGYFASVMGYVVIMFFLLVMGIFFALVVSYLCRQPTQLTAMKLVTTPSVFFTGEINACSQ